jgi:hypothetical protein
MGAEFMNVLERKIAIVTAVRCAHLASVGFAELGEWG